MSIIARYGMSGVFTATIMAGILLVLAGIFHLGRLTAYIPMPVIAGFTSGISVIIALGQLDNFFGVTSAGGSAVEKFISYFTGGFSPNWIAVAIGAAVIVFMAVYPKKWNRIVPASLVAIVLATAATMLFSPEVGTVGKIPSSLLLEERFSFAGFRWSSVDELLTPAVSIAALGMIESLLCGASAGRMTGVRLDNDRELVAQGIGNILSPLFGGIPATADDLSARSVSLINILIAENSFLNGLLDPDAAAPVLISSLDDTVSLDAKLLGSALPYGLCALLMLPDDPDEAALLHNRYVQAIVRIKSELPAKRQDITEVYGRT